MDNHVPAVDVADLQRRHVRAAAAAFDGVWKQQRAKKLFQR
jgi:hypothetical protein